MRGNFRGLNKDAREIPGTHPGHLCKLLEVIQRVFLFGALAGKRHNLKFDAELVTARVEMDVLGIAYDQFSTQDRDAVVAAYPRESNFKEGIIEAFANGIKHKPQTMFGNVKAGRDGAQGGGLHAREFLQFGPGFDVERRLQDAHWTSRPFAQKKASVSWLLVGRLGRHRRPGIWVS